MKFRGSLFVLALAAALIVAGPVSAGAAKPKPAPKPQLVKVTMFEFGFKLSSRTVPVGTPVVFEVANKGKVVHDFEILGTGKKTPVWVGSKVYRLTVTFKKPGAYRIQCTVPGHIDAGMFGFLTVK